MTRARLRGSLLMVMLAATLALAPLMLHHPSVVSACGDGDICSGYGGGGSGADTWQQAAGATIILAADAPAVALFLACGLCGEPYDWWVALPATAFGLWLIYGASAEASGSGGSGFYDGYSGGGGGGGGGGAYYSADYSYGGGSW